MKRAEEADNRTSLSTEQHGAQSIENTTAIKNTSDNLIGNAIKNAIESAIENAIERTSLIRHGYLIIKKALICKTVLSLNKYLI